MSLCTCFPPGLEGGWYGGGGDPLWASLPTPRLKRGELCVQAGPALP